ncbi:MAG: DUF2892 domain-containing protein [Nitrospirae bacterium]|nr:DUF2892 domain-containing protein [Nitrospirota bacterium]
MTERTFRLILGLSLVVFLFFDLDTLIYVYIGVLIFEGITNWRIPILISRLRFGEKSQEFLAKNACPFKFDFEAERSFRFVIAGILIITFVIFHEPTWFLPWLLGFGLTMAGITGICPIAISLRWLGFK